MANPRTRLDQLLVDEDLASTRSQAKALIMAGRVEVNGVLADKPGTPVRAGVSLRVTEGPRFVSRGGEKLAHALSEFGVEVEEALALDVGASTGGFTDCLLKAGAAKVIALDVGRGQIDNRLREDPRVEVLEGVNARYLEPDVLAFVPDFLTVDVSFISLRTVLPALDAVMAPRFRGLLLVKPQFEAGPQLVGRKGVVRRPAVHEQVLLQVSRFVVVSLGWSVLGLADSGLLGPAGNREFFIFVERGSGEGAPLDTLAAEVRRAVGEHQGGRA